ncbi:hypothetical protein Fcan01_22712 [Folsomia candida]|uniref:Uncharacterized protein n=1 Tax=Folsomia candida TaxID=158441 RepID=A0A226DB03_FOLCA|nr:hypothetical protein Fcan01_22712 [Folsomia candida]
MDPTPMCLFTCEDKGPGTYRSDKDYIMAPEPLQGTGNQHVATESPPRRKPPRRLTPEERGVMLEKRRNTVPELLGPLVDAGRAKDVRKLRNLSRKWDLHLRHVRFCDGAAIQRKLEAITTD